jgi:lysophospholipase L1-like esterase
MCIPPRTLKSTLCFVGVFFAVTHVFGQSLSVGKGESNLWIVEANAPAGQPHSLQESENLRLWYDVKTEVQGAFSFSFTHTNLVHRYFRLLPTAEPPPAKIVMIIGDSMASECCGWGGGIPTYFKPEATILQYAQPWTSTERFLQSSEYQMMLLVKPDYVLVQYGFIDSSTDEHGTTLEEFEANVRTIIDSIRGFDGTPILVALHAMRRFDSRGFVIPGWGPQNSIMKRLAAEYGLHYVDFYSSTRDLFNRLGPEGVEFMHWTPGGAHDVMHFSPAGAVYVSRLLAKELPDELAPYLTHLFDPPPLPQ